MLNEFQPLTFDPVGMVFRDDMGIPYGIDASGRTYPLETTIGSDPKNIDSGGWKKFLEQYFPGLPAKIDQTQTPSESWIDTLVKLVPAITMTAQQQQLMQLNIERAKKGLPPVDIASYTGIGVNVGLSPDTKNLLIFGGIALVAVFFLTRKKS
jgi:hypothetical protein